jgi:phage anti-repressor protein
MELTPEIIFGIIRSESKFPVDFDDAWQWIGYTRKDSAKDLLEARFDKGFDFSGEDRKNGKRGRPVEKIFLTVDCFKQFCMMAETEKGKQVRRFYLNCEEELKRRIEEERIQNKQNKQQHLVAAMVSEKVVSRKSRFPDRL